MMKKILVFGAGYVGSSLSVLLAEHYEVKLIDIDKEKVNKINCKLAPINEPLLQELLVKNSSNLAASISYKEHLANTDMVILALPTNYNEKLNFFDTSILEMVLSDLSNSVEKITVVIKSTIPIGYTEMVSKAYPNLIIVFVPEFLREGKAIFDNIYPSRIVIGAGVIEKDNFIAEVFLMIAKNNPEIIYMSSSDAEAVKLFANTYLATRVSFFNELDSFALSYDLNTKNIIDGMCSDPRIGEGYNNPSFGYGGYCLPKDSKQLLANYGNIPQSIIGAVIESNKLRKEFIAEKILERKPKLVGAFRLVMKKSSDNFRESAIYDLIRLLGKLGIEVLIYEPLLENNNKSLKITKDLEYFKTKCDLILANRMDEELISVAHKVFTRDIYGEN